jgi:phage/plasmid primase-like uncharacterized protein
MTQSHKSECPAATGQDAENQKTNKLNSATDGTSEQEFLAAIEAAGLTPPYEIIADGQIHRFSSSFKVDDDAGWYVLHVDGVAAGVFGCWRAGLKSHWCSKSTSEMTQTERVAYQDRLQSLKALRDSEQAQRHAGAAKAAAIVFDEAPTCIGHPYLTTKDVQAYGIRQAGDNLLIPLYDSAGTLHSLQIITPDGDKRFLPGGRVKGCFHGLRGSPGVLLICEGYATGASLHEATGYQVAVAFNAGNLERVALDLCAHHPDLKIVIAADDDYQTEGNPGKTKARSAAAAVGGYLAVPDFGANRPEKATDFNDLHQLSGLHAVKRCIEAALSSVPAIASNALSTVPLEDALADTHRNAPRPDPACLYGLVGDIAQAGSNNTEANGYAVAASALAYLGAALGRGPYFPIGDDRNHARLFLVHVGRSSRGRKGTAKKLIYRIHNALQAINGLLVPQVHSGGLSTREGLALMIHDGYRDGKNEVPAIEDKRLLVVESEFSNVLHQSKRDGNTLSGALRDAWDGTSIKPAVKTCPVWASDPHISIIGDITPSELRELMHKRELTNGFANRFIFFWAEGDKVVPFPQPTPMCVVEALADRVAQVLRFAGADRPVDTDVMCMEFSPEAVSLYERLYRGELRDRSAGEHITGLLVRRAPVLLRLAMLFALTDQTRVITVEHINAAMAWVRYWVDSVKFIFQSAVDEAGATATTDMTQRIVTYLAAHGQATRTELTKGCFGGHVSKAKLDQALDELITASPPAIEVVTVPRPLGQPGSPSKVYKPCAPPALPGSMANSANSAECDVPCGFTADIEPVRNVRTERTEVDSPEWDVPHFAQFAESAAPKEPALTRMDIDTSQISLRSLALVENLSDDDLAVYHPADQACASQVQVRLRPTQPCGVR